MKILLVNKFHYMKGGAERYYFTLADALKKSGHEVIFFSMKDEKNIPCAQEKYFVKKREYNNKTSFFEKLSALKNFIYSKESYNNMNKLLDDEKPDIVILNNIHRQITTSIVDAIYEHNIKVFWVVHDLIMLCPNYTMLNSKGEICEKCCKGNYKYCLKYKCVKNSFFKSILAIKEAKYNTKNRTYDKINTFITPSNFYREKLIEYGFEPKKIVSIKNPLPFDTKYEINNHDDKYILYFGRLSKEKGVKTLIDAMKDIDYKLIILGTGSLETELKEYVSVNKINNVEFKGFKQGEELKNYIRNSRCVVLPSEWYENGPYSAMEAMALGKPLIVSSLGGLPELVDNDKNGYIFKNKEELKEYIKLIINLNEEKYTSLCYNSYEKAILFFQTNKYVEELMKL